MEWDFSAEVWVYPGDAAWHFVTLPQEIADEIVDLTHRRQGFGAVPVEVVVGTSRWRTSLFPHKAAGSYVLPVKKAIRQAEDIEAGDCIRVALVLRT